LQGDGGIFTSQGLLTGEQLGNFGLERGITVFFLCRCRQLAARRFQVRQRQRGIFAFAGGLGQRARQQREKILRALSAFSGQRAAGRIAVSLISVLGRNTKPVGAELARDDASLGTRLIK